MPRFFEREVGRSVGNESDFRASASTDDRLGNVLPGGIVLLGQPVDRRFVVIGFLGVTGLRVMSRSASEIRRERVVGAGERTPGNAVAIDIGITAPLSSQLLEPFFR